MPGPVVGKPARGFGKGPLCRFLCTCLWLGAGESWIAVEEVVGSGRIAELVGLVADHIVPFACRTGSEGKFVTAESEGERLGEECRTGSCFESVRQDSGRVVVMAVELEIGQAGGRMDCCSASSSSVEVAGRRKMDCSAFGVQSWVEIADFVRRGYCQWTVKRAVAGRRD